MEEILSSIRRIISEDGEPAADAAAEAPKGKQAKPALVPKEGASPPPGPNVTASPPPRAAAPTAKGEPVLDLTDMVQADGTVVNLNQRAAPAKMKANEAPMADPMPMPMPMPTSAAMTRPRAAEPMAPSMQAGRDEGLVSRDTARATTEAFAKFAGAVSSAKGIPIGDGSQTLQDVVAGLLRPMLREWLDRNLQPIVSRAVEREITKLAGRAEDH